MSKVKTSASLRLSSSKTSTLTSSNKIVKSTVTKKSIAKVLSEINASESPGKSVHSLLRKRSSVGNRSSVRFQVVKSDSKLHVDETPPAVRSASLIESLRSLSEDDDESEGEYTEESSAEHEDIREDYGEAEELAKDYEDDVEEEEISTQISAEDSFHEEIIELDSETEKKRAELIERCLAKQQQFRFLQKKNAFLQDKLYKLCLRKGYILADKDDDKTKDERRRRRKKKLSIRSQSIETDEGVDTTNKSDSISSSMSRESIRSRLQLLKGNQLHSKYSACVEHVLAHQRARMEIVEALDLQIAQLQEHRLQSNQQCLDFFQQLMDRMAEVSRRAVNSNSGRSLSVSETQQFTTEIQLLFEKLRKTTLLFYRTWHGLNYDLKRLEEQEVTEQGLSMLEYEQLCGEAVTLKDKAAYHEHELEKQKSKISSSVQVLAHYKEKEFRVNDNLVDAITTLNEVNNKLKYLAELMDNVTVGFAELRSEQRKLQEQSGLMDNVRLMRDFEKTNGDVMSLKEEKRRLGSQARKSQLEILSIQNKIQLLKKINHPKLRTPNATKDTTKMLMAKSEKHPTRNLKAQDYERLKTEWLLRLLHYRHHEPWKDEHERILKSSNAVNSKMVTRIPCSCSGSK